MNVVFIDIDGPILPLRMWAAAENIRLLEEKVVDRSPHLRFDPGCVGLVVRLCDLSGARLVLASNWRRTWAHDLSELHAKLVAEGLRADLWHEDWMLPVFDTKAAELVSWLAANQIEAGIFIDNEPISTPDPVRMITVSEDDGFGLPDYRHALAVFGKKDPRDTRSG